LLRLLSRLRTHLQHLLHDWIIDSICNISCARLSDDEADAMRNRPGCLRLYPWALAVRGLISEADGITGPTNGAGRANPI
jgi:hypothetical protein